MPLGVPLRQYEDAYITEQIEAATAAVEDFCERVFAEETFTEVFRGDGTATFLLPQYPLVGITSLTETTIGTDPVETEYDLSHLIRTTVNDSCGRLELDGSGEFSAFSPAALYEVVYTAGYDPIPAPVRKATAIWVTEFLKPDYGGASQEVPEIVPQSTQTIVDLLTPYKRRRI